jgi:hypothetical protein
MSADRWGICSKCTQEWNKKLKELKIEADNSYGKVPAEEYLNLLDRYSSPERLDESLREDWEIYMGESGKFFFNYSCSCIFCKFSYEYRYEENILKLKG